MDLFQVVNPDGNSLSPSVSNNDDSYKVLEDYSSSLFNPMYQSQKFNEKRSASLDSALGLLDGNNLDSKEFFKAINGLDSGTKDYLTNWFIQERMNKSAYDLNIKADSTKYLRAVKDLEKAGINPFMVLNGLGPGNVSVSPGSASSGSYMQAKEIENERNMSILRLFGTIIAALGAAAFGFSGKIGAAGISAASKSFPRFR